jgi:hypothetical protein
MTPALLLTAALSLGQQPPPAAPRPGAPTAPALPKAPADAPRGLPVMLSYVTADDSGRISSLVTYPTQQVRDVKVKDPTTGREVVQKQTVTVPEYGLAPIPEAAVKITTTAGKPVTYADAAKQVKGGKVVATVWAFEDKKADPAYLKALKDDILVFEMQPGPPPGSTNTPPKKD